MRNKNKLLHTMEGCIGVKTGYTDDAGRCLVSAIEKDGIRLVCVVLNCGPMFPESQAMLSECADKFALYDLTELYDFQTEIPVVRGRDEFAEIGTSGHFVFPLTKEELARLKFVYTLPDCLPAPLPKEVGKVEIFLDNDLLFCEKIFTIDDVKPKSVVQRMRDFFKEWQIEPF